MGTLFGITLWVGTAEEAKAGFAAAFSRVGALNRILSDYEASSEVNSLDQTPRVVSRELYDVLRFSRELSESSGGAFDVTVGPLTRLWRKREPMTDAARSMVDWRQLQVTGGKVWLRKAGMRLDLGAVGKGYAGDEALRVLRGMGIRRALVAASGDIVCGDPPPGARGWAVAAGGSRLELRRAAVSTSGDTEQFFERDGRRYSHILDARRGEFLTDVLEVSVVAANGMTADALATAVRVMGVAAAAGLLRRFGGRVVGRRA